MGAAAGHAIGGAFGAGAGMLADTYGGQAVKTAIDMGLDLKALASSKYLGPIMEAAKRGKQQLAVTHYILAQTEEGYRDLMGDPVPNQSQEPKRHALGE